MRLRRAVHPFASNRDAVYRILKAEGLGRLPPEQRNKRRSGTFKDYDLGFVHMDIRDSSYSWVDVSGPGEPARYVSTKRPAPEAKDTAAAAAMAAPPTKAARTSCASISARSARGL